MVTQDYADCLAYIDSYWDKIICKPQKKHINRNVIEIPFPYITPNDTRFNYIFYWDTYFMFKGIMGTKREGLMKNMVDNFVYIFDKYGIIPNFNSPASTGRSQPPFLTSMILDAYNSFSNGNRVDSTIKTMGKALMKPYRAFGFTNWLVSRMEIAKEEYQTVWQSDAKGGIGFYHRVEEYGLNRYGDRDNGFAHSSELESAWDMTSRFYNQCDQFLPIDLNCLLYIYELDFASVAHMMGKKDEHKYWQDTAKQRKMKIQELMWNEAEGFFYDFGFRYKTQSDFLSLAGFVPLWAGVATKNQAGKMVKKLVIFESDYGLIITAKDSLAESLDLSKIQKRYHPAIHEIIDPKQWDYPNTWPPLEYLTVIGLLRYGFIDDAKRIMKKSLAAQAGIFRKYGTFFEKINGITGDKQHGFHYPNQEGFGWTNAVFYRYCKILESLEKNEDIYTFPKPDIPPYDLAILH